MQNRKTRRKYGLSTFQMAASAIFAALVAAVTYVSAIFIPVASGGFFNVGEVLIYVAALLLGPFVGLIAGTGATIADVLIAPAYAPATFIIKSLEGFLAGCLMKGFNRKIKSLTLCASMAMFIGGVEMVVGYFMYETFMWGYPVALVSLPFNIVQMVAGLIIAVPVMHMVLRVFPQLRNYL